MSPFDLFEMFISVIHPAKSPNISMLLTAAQNKRYLHVLDLSLTSLPTEIKVHSGFRSSAISTFYVLVL